MRITTSKGRLITSLETMVDRESKTIHLLDNDQGKTLTNCITEVYSLIFGSLCSGMVKDWKWLIYDTDGYVSECDVVEGKFTHVRLDSSELHEPFVEVMKSRRVG